MRFSETGIDGLWLIETEPRRDERGQFARTFCAEEFGRLGLAVHFVQHSESLSVLARTRRGLHFQRAPHQEVKLVSCGTGAMWDVAVDLRSGSRTFGHWYGVELTPENGRTLYIPGGFAHGFQTLVDQTRTRYMMSALYAPEAAGGLAHDDPTVSISWPDSPAIMSDRDRTWPLLTELASLG
jgi:dTDP-4-dehydrorhamnose 3,5-epimerase